MESPRISFGAYVIVENADLYQEILGGLTGIADLKLVGSSGGLPPDGSFHIDLFILGAAEEDGARRGLEALRRSSQWGLTPVKSPQRLRPRPRHWRSDFIIRTASSLPENWSGSPPWPGTRG
ncbi:MAG: hypothetical protein WHT07_08985 [Desulfobaccales bacterium]